MIPSESIPCVRTVHNGPIHHILQGNSSDVNDPDWRIDKGVKMPQTMN